MTTSHVQCTRHEHNCPWTLDWTNPQMRRHSTLSEYTSTRTESESGGSRSVASMTMFVLVLCLRHRFYSALFVRLLFLLLDIVSWSCPYVSVPLRPLSSALSAVSSQDRLRAFCALPYIARHLTLRLPSRVYCLQLTVVPRHSASHYVYNHSVPIDEVLRHNSSQDANRSQVLITILASELKNSIRALSSGGISGSSSPEGPTGAPPMAVSRDDV